MSAPYVSVIVPTRNRPELLARCLDALYAQTLVAHTYEIVVVDDGSDPPVEPRTEDREPPCAVTFIRRAHAGAGSARNAGAAQARGSLLVFLDDDVIAEPGLLADHIHAHVADRECAVVGALQVDLSRASVSDVLKQRLASRQSGLSGRELQAFDLLTGNFSIPAETFRRIGCFDESLPRHEDYDLARRLKLQRIELRYCPEARGVEQFSRGNDLALQDAYDRGLSQGMLVTRGSAPAGAFDLGRFFRGGWAKRALRQILWYTLSFRPFNVLLGRVARSQQAALRAAIRPLSAINYWHGVHDAFRSIRRFKAAVAPRLVVLGYHLVDDDVCNILSAYSIRPAVFERQMKFLKRVGFSSVTIAQWQKIVRGEEPSPARPIAITIDDGDERTIDTVEPILRQLGFSATVFVPADYVGGRNDWDVRIGAQPRGVIGSRKLQQLARDGFEIGCHGASHRSLPGLTDDELARELVSARHELEIASGAPVLSFALPYGNADQRVLHHLKDAGYTATCTSFAGINTVSEAHLIRRLFIPHNDGDFRFRLRLAFAPFTRITNIRFFIQRLAAAYRRAMR